MNRLKNVFSDERSGQPGCGLPVIAMVGRSALFVLFAILLWSGSARATPIIPTGYTNTPAEGVAEGGLLNYYDDTGNQLIDGIYGVNDWAADLGNGSAYEWVGWRIAEPVMTFQFSEPVTINQVGIDFNRNEAIGSYIFLPLTVTVGGTDFAVATNAISDNTRDTLYFTGSWTGSTLAITLTDNDPTRWIFVDEITFDGTPVPEPSFFCLLGIGFGALIARRRTKADER